MGLWGLGGVVFFCDIWVVGGFCVGGVVVFCGEMVRVGVL